MDNKKSNKDLSRINWCSSVVSESGYLGDENIKIGCLQRMADAMEVIANDKERLERDYEWMKKSRDDYRRIYESAMRRNSSLRGVITKLKKKVK